MSETHRYDRSRTESLDESEDKITNVDFTEYENKYCKRWSRIPIFRRFLIIGILIGIIYIIDITIHIFDKYKTNESVNDTLLASMSSYSIDTCEDHRYGCCEIYDKCKIINSDYIDYETIHISVYREYPHNPLKTNCPRMRNIITEYNRHYSSNDCGEYGCCPDIDIGCDEIISKSILNGNNKKLVNDYLINGTIKRNVNVSKEDSIGSNCWNNDGFLKGTLHFIDKYEHYYPLPITLSPIEIIIKLLVGLILLCIILFPNIHNCRCS